MRAHLFGVILFASLGTFAQETSFSADAPAKGAQNAYTQPTPEESAPLRAEYLAELAKIHEPPEIALKPMRVRKPVPSIYTRLFNATSDLVSPAQASHDQRAKKIQELLEIVGDTEPTDASTRSMAYSLIATISCFDGISPATVIGYANNAIGGADEMLALRAKMYFRLGDKKRALDDLETIMSSGTGQVLTGGGVDPRKASTACEWSIEDFDAMSADPRALSAKAFYLSAYIGYGAADRGTASESDIKALYTRSANLWRSPIPHYLVTQTGGLGSAAMRGAMGCIRGLPTRTPKAAKACEVVDAETRSNIRALTMALVIDSNFSPARLERAEAYLSLAEAYYADNKPSRQFFELAIGDFTAVNSTSSKELHTAYCDRAMALASLGRYKEAVSGYLACMKHAKDGIEQSPFVYQQLASVYLKLGRPTDAATTLTQAIMNSTSGLESVILLGGMGAFRALYPEYDLLPDGILADMIRRRFCPQFPQTWNSDFTAGKRKIMSSISPELYVVRADAYLKAGKLAEAQADYQRVKSDAWQAADHYLPGNLYFDRRGMRNFEAPEPWPPTPPKL
jgi:tetratricopeptide (TPR) repeat protein